ncbi:MAG: hypothetical protein O7D91_01890 [Planctomycetota bacterium]|nr:hypothetical protein [Planctomycetota bacterium]
MRRATIKQLQAMEQRYFELVWYARSTDIDGSTTVPCVTDKPQDIEDEIEDGATAGEAPIEMERAKDVAMLRDNPAYHSAFNEGAMAAFRYALEPESELAKHPFPCGFMDS